MKAFDASSSSTSSNSRSRSAPFVTRRAAGVFRAVYAFSTSAVSAGMRAMRAARSARASAARAIFVVRRRIAMPATTNSCAVLNAGGRGAGSSAASVARLRRCARSAEAGGPRDTGRRCICAVAVRLSVTRAKSSAFAGQLRSRETSAISAWATTHLARATASFGPKARSTSQQNLRSNEIAELRHRNAAKRQSRRVVAQGDPLKRAEGITHRQCARRGTDYRVHRNPVILVTPTLQYQELILACDR